ncbi:speedy protein C-like [Erinaceus europaeus]|uniref:Speedy protein C-like n=1 Tax=Erinaceus europaeus TaxID=9365 RepID=A0ABM3VRK5_ERIEU|nr:speedy protein C-like [Erinaceus europaeus]
MEYKLFLEFLSNDPCLQISDKYLLVMVLVFFQHVKLQLSKYTLGNLFLALYLANDMEEDLEDPKCVIFSWALSTDWLPWVGVFLSQREELWVGMDFCSMVSCQCCEEVMGRQLSHWAWTRR